MFRARRDGDVYALKVRKREDDPSTRPQFRREATTLARLRHPVLPRVRSAGTVGGRPYLVMEYIDGRPLSEVLEAGPLSERDALRLGMDVARGLAALHRADQVHRDVKPANILWDGESAHLVDFGLITRSGRQRERERVGTFAYAAPEQTGMLNRPLDGRSDLYALGVVLYRALSGALPYEGENLEALARDHAVGEAEPVGERVEGVSEELADILDQLLATEPDRRIADAEALWSRLAACLGEVELETDERPGAAGASFGGFSGAILSCRAEETAPLFQQWKLVQRTQRGGLALVCGEAGVGKSTVLRGFVGNIRGRHGHALDADCSPEDPNPFAVVRDLVAPLLSALGSDGEAGSVEPDELIETDIEREYVWQILRGEDVSSGSQDVDLAGICARYLGRLARSLGGASFVVDDIHWSDEPSLEVLRQLGLMLDRFPVQLVIGCDRSQGMASGDRIWRATRHLDELDAVSELLELPRAGRRVHLELEPLTRSQTALYLESYLNGSLVDSWGGEYLHSATGGQLLLLGEYLEVFLDEFVLRPSWEGWEIDRDRLADVELSDDARMLQEQRVDEVDSTTRRLCALAATWGGAFPADLIATAADLDEMEGRERLEEAARTGLIVEEEAGESRYRFTHESVRRALLERFDERSRAEFRRRLAEVADRAPEVSDYMAARLFAAGDGSAPERVFEVCRRAGIRAVGEGAFGDGVRFLEAAREAAEQLGREVSAQFDYQLGRAYLQRDRVEAGRRALKRAMARSDDPLERAACQMELNEVAVARFELGRLEEGVRRLLGLLGADLPKGTLGLGTGLMLTLVKYGLNRWLSRSPEGGERHRLLVYAYDQMSLVGVFDERALWSGYAQFGRMNAAQHLEPSYEVVMAYTSMAVVSALIGRDAAADEHLARAREIAEETGSPHARVRSDITEGWCRQIRGESQAAVEQLETALAERGEQLNFTERRLSYEVMCWDLATRGHSTDVLEWFDHWCSVAEFEIGGGKAPPAPLYGTIVIQARFCGRDQLADALLEASERTAEIADSVYLAKVHGDALVGDRALSGASLEAIDRAIAHRRGLGLESKSAPLWTRTFYVYQVYARWHQLVVADGDRRAHYVEKFGAAVDELLDAIEDHPILLGHARVAQAERALLDGEGRAAGRFLAEAERLARDCDNRWVACHTARVRAEWLEERELPPARRENARRAVRLAEQNGWVPHADHLRHLFDLTDEPIPGVTESSTDGGAEMRAAELERQLDGLLEVIAATESVLDPTTVQRVALDAAVDVLGAERGLLFLSGEEETFELQRGRSSGGEDLDVEVSYNGRIVDRVVETGRPAVMTAATSSDYEVRSAIAVPLQIDDEFVGVLYLDSRVARGLFDEGDIDVLRAIANQLGVAIATARSAQLEVEVAAERKRRSYAEQLRAFAEEVTAMLDTTDILVRLVEQLRETLAFDSAVAALVDDERVRIDVIVSDRGLERRPFAHEKVPEVGPDSPLVTISDHGQMRVVEQVREAGDRPDELNDQTASWLGLPVETQDGVYGVVLVGSDTAHHFNAADIEGALAYASQAGVAVAKARLATVDPLTGVYNRRKLFELAEREFARADRYPSPLSVLMLDIDDFKAVNDTYGHAAGDRLLEEVADICRNSLRETDILGRYGGEEFAVVLPSTERRDVATVVAERLRKAIGAASVDVGEESLSATVSIGVAERRESDEDVHVLFERADEALYEAKAGGKDQVAE